MNPPQTIASTHSRKEKVSILNPFLRNNDERYSRRIERILEEEDKDAGRPVRRGGWDKF